MGRVASNAGRGCNGLRASVRLTLVLLFQIAPRAATRSRLCSLAPNRSAEPRLLLRPDRWHHVGCRLRSDRPRAKELHPASARDAHRSGAPRLESAVIENRQSKIENSSLAALLGFE